MGKKQLNKNRILLFSLLAIILMVAIVYSGYSNLITGEAKGGKPGKPDKPGGGGGKVKAQCNDNIDNDGDGYCDFLTRKTRCNDGSTPGDPDCASKDDNKEDADCEPVPERCDGFDNDCDGEIDEGLPVTCGSASNCGQTGWLNNTYCGADGNTHRDWVTYQCNFPGTCSSSCSSQTEDYVYEWCDNGCNGGVCNPSQNSCSDTDGGYDLSVKGTVSGYQNGNPYEFTEYCISSTNSTEIMEYYCVGDGFVPYLSNCLGNFTTACLNGACI